MSNQIPLHVVLVTGIVKKGNKYLLAQRSHTDDQAAGEWALPGGKVEIENGMDIIENTLKREIMEEVGIEIEAKITFICSDAFVRSSGDHVVSLIFLCEYKIGEAKPLEDQAAVSWFTLKEMLVKDDLPKYVKGWLKKI